MRLTEFHTPSLTHATAAHIHVARRWHLRTVLKFEPTNARMALALADVLLRGALGKKKAAAAEAKGEAAKVVKDCFDRLVARSKVGVWSEYEPGLAEFDKTAIAAAYRRLGAWLVQNGARQVGKEVLAAAVGLDKASMRDFARSEL